MFVPWKTADRKVVQEVAFNWHQTNFTNLKNVFLPTEFLWSSTVSHVSLTRYFWAVVRGITAVFPVDLWEDDPQPMLVTNRRHLHEVQKLNWKTIFAKKISIALADWQLFHMTCLTPLLFNTTKLLRVGRLTHLKVHCCKMIDTDCWKRKCKLKILQHVHWFATWLERSKRPSAFLNNNF